MSTLYVQHRYLSSKDSEKIVIIQAAIVDIVFIKMVVFRLLMEEIGLNCLFGMETEERHSRQEH